MIGLAVVMSSIIIQRIMWCIVIIGPSLHRRQQSSVGTRARLSYATFDVQLWKEYFVTTLYTLCTSVQHVFASSPRNMSVHDLKSPRQCPGMPGPAGAYASLGGEMISKHYRK